MAKKKPEPVAAPPEVVLLIPKPVAMKPTVKDGELGEYQTAEGETLFWSGEKRLPAIGRQVPIWLNHLGLCVVRGYWRRGKHLGVIAECFRDGKTAHHVFGSEIGELDGGSEPRNEKKRVKRKAKKSY